MVTGSRVFTLEDQKNFAVLSGDGNPLHVDPLRARRSQFGRPVVHGMNLVLWALDSVLAHAPTVSLATLSCVLRHPVGIGDTVKVRSADIGDGGGKITLGSDNADCAVIHFTWQFTRATQADDAPFTARPPRPGPCRDWAIADLAQANGAFALEMSPGQAQALYPSLAAKIAPGQIALIAATSRLVGMECPGLHSIYAELSLDFAGAPAARPAAEVQWSVTDYDDRFQRLTLAIAAGRATGTIQAMLRPKPQPQPDFQTVKDRLGQTDRYRGQKALIIGGSRGLGELCAKMLAAGGADIGLTYHSGQGDADRVVSDIMAGGGRARSLAYDIFSPPLDLAQRLGPDWLPTHIYYFPTPPIFVAARGKFSADLFSRFCRYYVDGFYACAQAVRGIAAGKLSLFYPSTVAVATAYPAMGEYAAAKAAGENLCQFLQVCDKTLHVKSVRLPRLPSDQTLTVVDVETDDPIDILQGILDDEVFRTWPL